MTADAASFAHAELMGWAMKLTDQTKAGVAKAAAIVERYGVDALWAWIATNLQDHAQRK